MATDWKSKVFQMTVTAIDATPEANVVYEDEALRLVEEARAEGRREGLREAAKECDDEADAACKRLEDDESNGGGDSMQDDLAATVARALAIRIESLASKGGGK